MKGILQRNPKIMRGKASGEGNLEGTKVREGKGRTGEGREKEREGGRKGEGG